MLFILTAVIGSRDGRGGDAVRESSSARVHQPHIFGRAGNSSTRDWRPGASWCLGSRARRWRLVSRFMVTAATNGLAIGMLGPLFGSTGSIGATASTRRQIGKTGISCSTWWPPCPICSRDGCRAVRLGEGGGCVPRNRVGSAPGIMVVMPSFWLAGLLYGARMIFNTLSIPVRQSF